MKRTTYKDSETKKKTEGASCSFGLFFGNGIPPVGGEAPELLNSTKAGKGDGYGHGLRSSVSERPQFSN